MNTTPHVHENLCEIPVWLETFKKISDRMIGDSLDNAGSTSQARLKTSGPDFSQAQFKSFQTPSFGLVSESSATNHFDLLC